jgi:hypothetical protein
MRFLGPGERNLDRAIRGESLSTFPGAATIRRQDVMVDA